MEEGEEEAHQRSFHMMKSCWTSQRLKQRHDSDAAAAGGAVVMVLVVNERIDVVCVMLF